MSRTFNLAVVVLALLQVFLLSHGDAARILVSFPPAVQSHFILGKALVKGLLEKGHQVTFISSFGIKKEIKGLEEIVFTEFNHHAEEMQKGFLNLNEKSLFDQYTRPITIIYELTDIYLNHTKIQSLMKTQKFDLVIINAFLNDAHVGLAHHFDCPLIVLSTMGSNAMVNYYVGNAAPPSYVPDIFGGYTNPMSFMERVKNIIFTYCMQMFYYGYHFPSQEKLFNKYFPDAPALQDIIAKRTALVLLNSHPSISPAKPSVPNMIEIGGFHVEEPKPLPKELKEYLDNAKQGFILFSMGSNIKSAMLPAEMKQTLMKLFAKLPYKILWKFEDDQLPGKPDNVKIEKWLPQNDILSHPNLRLFITHGGLLSTTEAIYHGVPLVGIPVFGDQAMNMAATEALGIGKTVPFKEVNYEKLFATVQEVLDNKSFREASRHRSALLRDQPLRPIDSAVYWIEYVLGHKYSDHLKTGAIYLTWYQKLSLDVFVFLGSIVFGVVFVLYLVVKKCCCRKGSVKKVHQQKKQQ